MSKAIVNLSTKKFWKGQVRLRQRLTGLTDADTFFFMKESEVGSPLQTENNYAFKVYAIDKIREKGYTQILWVDASMLPIKNIDSVFEIIEQDGYFFQNGGWKNKDWTNEHAKVYFGTDDGDMMAACCFGLDFENENTVEFWNNVKQAMNDGIFNGSWEDHRHDQTVMSILAYKMDMPLHEPNSIFEYAKDGDTPSKESIVLYADGIC